MKMFWLKKKGKVIMKANKYYLIALVACVIGSGEADNIITQLLVSLSCIAIAIYCKKKANHLDTQGD